MRAAGIDIGSRSIELVVIEGGRIARSRIAETTHDPVSQVSGLLEGVGYDRLVATGYGRRLAVTYLGCEAVSEIKAVSVGAGRLRPECRTILDIGGQDTKAVCLDESGKVRKFEMNDRCAAGTGRFLEVIATALGFSMRDFVAAAVAAATATSSPVEINSMCTVFAESEVVSMVARGMAREDVALGIHEATARRTVSMMQRVRVEPGVMFVGGVALNACMVDLVARGLSTDVHVPEEPRCVAALGAAILAST
ncbi:MAG: 3-hydroxyacyl-ACP dehydratase [Deltaproteobacteria bacterium]|nr:3-hydroxyacyl-ACP dehydratase [Deltaproteobacteria bacterium]